MLLVLLILSIFIAVYISSFFNLLFYLFILVNDALICTVYRNLTGALLQTEFPWKELRDLCCIAVTGEIRQWSRKNLDNGAKACFINTYAHKCTCTHRNSQSWQSLLKFSPLFYRFCLLCFVPLKGNTVPRDLTELQSVLFIHIQITFIENCLWCFNVIFFILKELLEFFFRLLKSAMKIQSIIIISN